MPLCDIIGFHFARSFCPVVSWICKFLVSAFAETSMARSLNLTRENKVYCARNFVNFPRFKANCVKSASKQEIFFFLPPAQVFKSIFCVIIINFPLLSANCGSERQIIESRCAIFCMQLAPLPSPRDLMLLNSRPEKCKNFQRPALANHEHIEIILKLCCQKYKSISLKEGEIERVARHESRLFQRIQSALVSRSFFCC